MFVSGGVDKLQPVQPEDRDFVQRKVSHIRNEDIGDSQLEEHLRFLTTTNNVPPPCNAHEGLAMYNMLMTML